MPRMLDKYTQEEETALTEINQKYSEPLKAAYARLDAALEAWTKRDDNQSREYYQALVEAPSYGKDIFKYKPNSKPAAHLV